MKAPQIVGDVWFNTRPLSVSDLEGKAVLFDFWAYSCINCLRTLPYLKEWWAKYGKEDFLIIGIHTPEFEFEKDPENVEKAIKELGVTWPVVVDNDYLNWNNLANHYWPAKYLSDKNGNIVYKHFGEGNYKETEIKIRELLFGQEGFKKYKVDLDEHNHGNVCFIPTPELYCGYKRGILSNNEGYVFDREADYKRPEEIKIDSIALSGKFLAKSEFVETKSKDSEILLNFMATEVNLVLSDNGSKVQVFLNKKPIDNNMAGKDVDRLGQLTIKESRMYNLLKSSTLMEGILTVKPVSGSFKAYAFTFSGCVI